MKSEGVTTMKQSKKLVNWFGYNRDDYYEFQWQRGDLHWEELGHNDDGDGCVYEDDILGMAKYIYIYLKGDLEHEFETTKEVYDSWERGDQDDEPLWFSARPDIDIDGIVGVFMVDK